MGWGGGYEQLCSPASPKLLLGLDLGLAVTKLEETSEEPLKM